MTCPGRLVHMHTLTLMVLGYCNISVFTLCTGNCSVFFVLATCPYVMYSVYMTQMLLYLKHQHDVTSQIVPFVLIPLDINGTQASAVGKQNIIIQHAYATNAIYDAISSQTVNLAFSTSPFLCRWYVDCIDGRQYSSVIDLYHEKKQETRSTQNSW